MKVAVWDTYVPREDGKEMHFDIVVPEDINDDKLIFEFGKQYLNTKPFYSGSITSNECSFCHIENAEEEVVNSIKRNGYHIIEMENCN